MSAAPGEPGLGPPVGARFFCTAGRGLEPFLMREVQARLAATQVEYISGKVFFSTSSDLNMLKKLKSAERLFLLIKKQLPFTVSSVSKGNLYNYFWIILVTLVHQGKMEFCRARRASLTYVWVVQLRCRFTEAC